jgi:uncharacterized membrane protein YhhN
MILKPMLMPVLIATVFLLSSPSGLRPLIITGLFFSFLGDVFLLFDHKNPLFFMAGLVCFLLTHILYISYFLKKPKTVISLLLQAPWLILLILLYTAGLLYVLFPGLGDLKIPVIVYAIILSCMLIGSIHLYNSARPGTGSLFVTGAGCFVISDSLLAINRFYNQVPYAGVFIIFSYCAAQLLIVKGFIKNNI